MPSHGVQELLSVKPVAATLVEARFVLECGCELTRELPADRVLDVSGGRLLVGKYPCPAAHPVVPRK